MEMRNDRTRWLYGLPLLLLLGLGLTQLLGGTGSTLRAGSLENSPSTIWRLHQIMMDSLVEDSNAWFVTAGVCARCHGHDTAGLAMVDGQGNDVNFTDDWRATMMANSARDPFWRAQVSHEGISAPGQLAALENECATCHAPLGQYSHQLLTGQEYSLTQLETDPLGLDGVSCLACHSQPGDSLGAFFSGKFKLDTQRLAFGPFPGPYAGPMVDSIGFIPVYGPHIRDAELCASCHTLITETLDLQGNPTGNTFVEQATYHEWLNSSYPGQGSTCQSCHVPELPGGAIVSAHYAGTLFPRDYGLHQFAGANVFMLRMLKAYRDSLDIPATAVQFDSVIARTERMLQQQTLDLDVTLDSRANDTAAFTVRLSNLAGHKFPSGYPSRRAFVEFVLRKQNGDTLFKSGLLGSDYELEGQDPGYEPHHRTIVQSDQVQIYELVMADVQGNVTTTLRRGAGALKDNRLVPQGFSMAHTTVDTTGIAGGALADPDFNFENGQEGSGSDRIAYRAALNGYTDSLRVSARVWYQTVRPAWLDEMFAHNSPAIDRFRNYFQASDQSPVLVAEWEANGIQVGLEEELPVEWTVWPNPVVGERVQVQVPPTAGATGLELFDVHGRKIAVYPLSASGRVEVPLGAAPGTYWMALNRAGQRSFKKVISLAH